MRFRLHPTVCRLGSIAMWTASSATGDGDGMTCFPINSESRFPFYLSICLIQVPQISQYLNESRLAYTILSLYLWPRYHAKCLAGSVSYLGITCPLINGASSRCFIYGGTSNWIGIESKVYVLFCKSSFQLELEISGNYFAVNFNLWRLWWSGDGSASCHAATVKSS